MASWCGSTQTRGTRVEAHPKLVGFPPGPDAPPRQRPQRLFTTAVDRRTRGRCWRGASAFTHHAHPPRAARRDAVVPHRLLERTLGVLTARASASTPIRGSVTFRQSPMCTAIERRVCDGDARRVPRGHTAVRARPRRRSWPSMSRATTWARRGAKPYPPRRRRPAARRVGGRAGLRLRFSSSPASSASTRPPPTPRAEGSVCTPRLILLTASPRRCRKVGRLEAHDSGSGSSRIRRHNLSTTPKGVLVIRIEVGREREDGCTSGCAKRAL